MQPTFLLFASLLATTSAFNVFESLEGAGILRRAEGFGPRHHKGGPGELEHNCTAITLEHFCNRTAHRHPPMSSGTPLPPPPGQSGFPGGPPPDGEGPPPAGASGAPPAGASGFPPAGPPPDGPGPDGEGPPPPPPTGTGTAHRSGGPHGPRPSLSAQCKAIMEETHDAICKNYQTDVEGSCAIVKTQFAKVKDSGCLPPKPTGPPPTGAFTGAFPTATATA